MAARGPRDQNMCAIEIFVYTKMYTILYTIHISDGESANVGCYNICDPIGARNWIRQLYVFAEMHSMETMSPIRPTNERNAVQRA